MIQFSKLRLSGFKSFVDKTEIDIGPGLNGIVGPNGCGKSNLVEALRWVMGGTSAKSFRGGGASMEHVIFAGTAKRPARNAASVQLLLDNSALTAPAPFHASAEIAVERQIQRDKGSTYRVNGKTVRARDVQTLFADSLTGANSPALVSQGRITRIIEAKPLERRAMLEESAGVAGLFTRRREAELRLKAAEENRQRAEDQTANLGQSLASLKRQAKQAVRYRELGEEIRTLDLAILWHGYHIARNRLKDISSQYDSAEQNVQKAMITARQAQTDLGKKQAGLPKMREEHGKLLAAAQKTRLTHQRLVDQKEAEALRQADQAQALAHIAAEKSRLQETLASLAVEIEQKQSLLSQQEAKAHPYHDQVETAAHILAELSESLGALERAYDSYEEKRVTLIREQEKSHALDARLAGLREEHDSLKTRLESETQADKTAEITGLEADITSLDAQIEAAQSRRDAADSDIRQIGQSRDDIQVSLRIAEKQISEKENEISRLKSKLDKISKETDGVVALLAFDADYADALQAAIGEDGLNAGTDSQSDAYWHAGHKTALPTLPESVKPLSELVEAPEALSILLAQTGIVDSYDAALAVLPQLTPGQAVVTRNGDIIRHDGLHRRAEGRSQGQAGFLLEQKQRLDHLRRDVEILQADKNRLHDKLQAEEAKIETAQAALETIQSERQQLTEQKNACDARLRDLQSLVREQTRRHEDGIRQLAQMAQRLQSLNQEKQGYQTRLTNIEQSLDAPVAGREEITAKREKREEQQSLLLSLQNTLRGIETETTQIRAELTSHTRLQEASQQRMDELQQRENELLAAQKTEQQRTQQSDHAADIDALAAQLQALEKQVEDSQEGIAEMERQERETSTHAREADSLLSDAREARALLSAELANAQEQFQELTADISENYAFTPQQLEETVLQSFASAIPEQAELKQKREHFIHRRESLGAVNLRAEEEAEALEQELQEATKDIQELGEAITQLHQGISKLNKEARARMSAAFEDANKHFKALFLRLFDGGDARLRWVDSDDPLSAGLEIEAQPPGKALQSLSLLSGGEQTLTATALIFGMFLSSPSPICVLDEIDAPLDDGNVERVCDLLEHLAKTSHTRFLIITHHRMTMARMDRLYGVTMAENGVSKLVSVDLNDHRQISMLSDDGESLTASA